MKAFNGIMRCIFLIFIWSVLLCITAFAGDINGNEQRIIGVIYGEFQAGGVTYRVNQEYIDSAIAYLSQDDVDLTPEQAQEAVNEIYANVSTGVESGYLYAVDTTPQTEAPTEAETQAPETQAPEAEIHETQGSGTQTAETQAAETEISETQPAETKATETQEAAQTQSVDDIIQQIKEKPRVITILEATANSMHDGLTDIESGTDIFMKSISYHTKEAKLFLLVLTVIVVLASIAVYFVKKYHKRRFYGILKVILTCSVCILWTVSIAGMSALIGAFNKSVVMNHMSESGYYQAVYEELYTDTQMSLALVGIPFTVMDDSVTYERVVTAARQQVEDRLNNGVFQADTTLISSKLEDNIRSYLSEKDIGLTEQAETGLNYLIMRLNNKYHDLLQWPYSQWWLYLSQRFFLYASYGAPVVFILFILSQVMLIYLHHYKHRGVRMCGYSIIASSLVSAAAALICILHESRVTRGISPLYMDVFFHEYFNGLFFAALILSFIGIMIGIVYVLTARYMKEER